MSRRTPWTHQGWVPTWAYIPVHDAHHNLVCSLYPNTAHGYTREEVLANADLIAAAPDMAAKAARLEEVNAKLVEALNGLVGLVQLVRSRSDCPIEIKQALTANYRLDDALLAIEGSRT